MLEEACLKHQAKTNCRRFLTIQKKTTTLAKQTWLGLCSKQIWSKMSKFNFVKRRTRIRKKKRKMSFSRRRRMNTMKSSSPAKQTATIRIEC